MVSVKFRVLIGEYLLLAVNVSTNSLKIFDITGRDIFQLYCLKKRSINMVKVLSFRFRQCFDPFTMLIVKGASEA